jgi:circadian clock protein KaiC
MARTSLVKRPAAQTLPKAPSGIQGLDEITGGGLPRGRPTLVCGGAGCGKTLLAMEFLVRGATQYGEPGVFMAFEENAAELAQNVRSLGFDLDKLVAKKQLAIDHVHVERSEIEETGDYDLGGLFVRLEHAIDSIGAKRVVLDTIETLFSGLSNTSILRAELRRLFRWLKDKGVTAVVTGERGEGQLTRQGLEEYVSDCVILLDNRMIDQVSTRRLRIVKYRGTTHGSNEYPFLIDEDGISILPITSLGLDHGVSSERVSTGIERLNTMLGGRGYYRGSSVLVSGTAGTGKTSLAAHFVDAACGRGERSLFFAFEESPQQIVRNMRSIGVDLQRWVDKGLLRFHSVRATQYGLETHLATFHKLATAFRPRVVVIDPIDGIFTPGVGKDAAALLVRLIDFFKSRNITALMTNLTRGGEALERSGVDISSLVDTWLFVRDIETGGERNRALYILKSRGMAHSNQIREFVLTTRGVDLKDVYLGPDGVLTGSARASKEAEEKAAMLAARHEVERTQRDLQRRREVLEAKIATMRKEFESEAEDHDRAIGQSQERDAARQEDRLVMGRIRRADVERPSHPARQPKRGRK